MSTEATPEEKEDELARHVIAVRLGHGANCSSVGSLIDTLFVSAVVVGSVFAAVCAAMKSEKVTVVPPPDEGADEGADEGGPSAPSGSRTASPPPGSAS
jgi:hypothetical protein